MPTTGDGARYHPGVIWGPFLLALALGLVVSAGLYFAYLWPQVEPLDDDEQEPKADTRATEEATDRSEPAPGESLPESGEAGASAATAEPPTATATEPPADADREEPPPTGESSRA